MVFEMFAVETDELRFCVPAVPDAIVVNTVVGARTGTLGVRILMLPAVTRTPRFDVGRR